MDKILLLKTFRNSALAVIYIFLVSQVMVHGENWFGKNNSMTPFVILLLFSFSAAVVGGLILGQSVILFLDKNKSESIKSAIYSISWLGLYTVLGLTILIFIK